MKIRCIVEYPWVGVDVDEVIVEVPDGSDSDSIENIANETIEEMLLERVSYAGWEVINE